MNLLEAQNEKNFSIFSPDGKSYNKEGLIN